MEDTNDFNKMKVIDLRKELKSRGLPSTGDKAMLIARLNASMSQISQDDHGDVTLDSDEIDSDSVLDEDDKVQSDNILDSLNEELALADNPPPPPPLAADPTPVESKPLHRTLKRKLTTDAAKKGDSNGAESKESAAKKIVLNRATSLALSTNATEKKPDHSTEIEKTDTVSSSTNKVKITADIDAKSKLELRAKRFGLPVKMTDEQRKEARKDRFSQNSSSVLNTNVAPGSLADNLDKLKKRAERFGQSVSKIMTDIENKEKLEKRKAKFGTVK